MLVTANNSVGKRLAYLEGILAADVVLSSHGGNDIAGQRNTAEHRLLSAVWREREREGWRGREGVTGEKEGEDIQGEEGEIWRKGKSKRLNISHHPLISSLPATSIITLS